MTPGQASISARAGAKTGCAGPVRQVTIDLRALEGAGASAPEREEEQR